MHLQPCLLQHLQFSSECLKLANTRVVPAFDASAWQEFVKSVERVIEGQTTCTVYLSSGNSEYIYHPPAR
jgi:hypothetical protein